jgi:hypothetical protein
MGLVSSILKLKFQTRVMRSLPGRLNLHVPLLASLPDKVKQHGDVLLSVLKIPDWITDVDVNYGNGAVNITYDEKRTRENYVIEWVNLLNRSVLSAWKQLAKIPDSDVPRVISQLKNFLSLKLKMEPTPDLGFDIPDHVWQ